MVINNQADDDDDYQVHVEGIKIEATDKGKVNIIGVPAWMPSEVTADIIKDGIVRFIQNTAHMASQGNKGAMRWIQDIPVGPVREAFLEVIEAHKAGEDK